jgi:hypothetical protein
METMMIQLHIWPVIILAGLIGLNIAVILLQKDNRKLKKYLRIQATAWTTLMSMIIFTGATTMAFLHLDFTVKIIVMIVAVIAMSTLELRRHLVIKASRPHDDCFTDVRKTVLRYYILQLLWVVMIGAFALSVHSSV